MYPNGAGISVMNLILCTYRNGQFDDYIIYEGMRLFVDADYARVVSDCLSISSILFTFLGITFYCKFVKQPFVNNHSTESETRAFYIVTRMEDYICHILSFLFVYFLKLYVDWRIVNPLLISYRLIKSRPESKILKFLSVTSMNSLISMKPVQIISKHTHNLLT